MFKRPTRPERQPMAWPSPVRGGVVVRADMGNPITASPKGEAAKPGKHAPTVAERQWMDWIVSRGCIACRLDGMPSRPPAVHHILRGGVRMGHAHTLPLCDPGHHQSGQQIGLISRHPWKSKFEKRYGTELELLAILQKEHAALTNPAQAATTLIA